MDNRLPNLPADISRDHPAFRCRGYGTSPFMRGKVLFYVVRISDTCGRWDNTARGNFSAYVRKWLGWLDRMSADHPYPVRTSSCAVDVILDKPFAFFSEAQYSRICETLFNVTSVKEMNEILCKKHNVNAVTVVFAFNYNIRGHARNANKLNPRVYEDEIAFVSARDCDRAVLLHEVFHLFGAVDYYYPVQYKDACLKYFQKSVMYDDAPEVDPLTAYLIGWTDRLSPMAVLFLKATANVTYKQICDARSKEWKKSNNRAYNGDK